MTPRIVDRAEWLRERLDLLAEEKAQGRARDALAARRRALPAVEVTTPYRLQTEDGPRDLAALFCGRRQLLVYHFMFGPDWSEGCPSCSFWADTFDGLLPHLAARDTAFWLVSRGPLDRLLAYRARMGWRLPWASAEGTGFGEDFGTSFDPPQDGARYNYRPKLQEATELPGISAFLRGPEGQVLHTYSAYARGIDALNGAYQLLDLTALGRDEEAERPMRWVRRHDRYDAA